jgi:G:T-mismatch repair DNA endonuclease (very short patch repair protein)
MNHLKEKRLAIIPHQGYDQNDTQSNMALRFLSFKTWYHNCHIQTAMSRGGEKRIGKYKLDGYIPHLDMGIEVHGCLYHGCPCRFPDPNAIVHHKNRRMTAAKVREEDEARLAFLRSKLKGGLQVFWECEIYAMQRDCKVLDQWMKRCQVPRHIRLRDCFFGGRTGPMRMHYKCPKGYKMAYFDFCR